VKNCIIIIFSTYFFIGLRKKLCLRERFLWWDAIVSEFTNLDDLRGEMEELRALVNTLLTVIMEEADGVHSGSAQPQTPLPKSGYSM
tara:strand:+ start:522 stop:782 length:261 start_codon:yes stop_codon:yes gene_type:complete